MLMMVKIYLCAFFISTTALMPTVPDIGAIDVNGGGRNNKNFPTMFDFAAMSNSRLAPFDIEAYTKAAVIRQNQENAFIAHMSTIGAARRAGLSRQPVKNNGTSVQREDVNGIPELLQRFLIQRERDHLVQMHNIMSQSQQHGLPNTPNQFSLPTNPTSDNMINRFLNQDRTHILQPASNGFQMPFMSGFNNGRHVERLPKSSIVTTTTTQKSTDLDGFNFEITGPSFVFPQESTTTIATPLLNRSNNDTTKDV
uniref:DUF148 domain-containing protein n=1 Tax=Rhabditophanes sp. KR3021 TaxID=114890 RepID=A0AC35TGS6_9BILA